MRRFLILTSLIVLLAMFTAFEAVSAQEDETACPPPTELGELSDILTASGSWSNDQCDTSQFVDHRPGQRFLFSLAEEAEVRIDLISPDRDTQVYLQDGDGRLIDADDDTGGGVNARIERTLPAGSYQIEASTVGWSGRESGSFELTLRVITGCHDVVDLGVLTDSLSTEAVWSHFGCESAFRPDRSSQRYQFDLTEATRVQIDLTSDVADSYVYLLDDTGTLLEGDDDGGVRFNSRIVRTLGAGTYTIEATNWGDRDLKNLQEAPYELNISIPEAGPIIKLEAIDAPDRVVLGMPFEINYRVGNLGDTPLSAINGSVQIRVRWPYISNWRTPRIGTGEGDDERWGVGASYHTAESVSAFGSESLPQIQPFEGSFSWRYGPTDVMLEALVVDEEGDRIDRHRLTRPIMVLSGIEIEPVTVSVEGVEYRVSAIAGDDGEVTTDVSPVASEEDEAAAEATATDESSDEEGEGLDPGIASRAIYAAGVQSQVVGDFGSTLESLRAQADALFSQVGRGGLPISEVENASAPTLDTLVATLNDLHSEMLIHAGFDPQEFQSVETAERVVVRAGRAAARRIDQFARDWSDLNESGRVLSADEALQLHAELSFAEQIDAVLVDAAMLVLMKRDAEDGWSDADVAAALEEFSGSIDCDADAGSLSFGDSALRQLSPVYGFMLDRAYCGAVAASEDHDLLLSGLDLSSNPVIPTPEVSDVTPAPEMVIGTRLLARVLGDGRVEFAVDLSNGERALPVQRMLPVSAALNRWLRTAPVIHDGEEIGRIYARRLGNGLVQATYVPTDVRMSNTSRWIVPEDAPVDAWLVSGELERGPASRDDLVQRIGDQAAGAGTAQFGDHLSLLSLIENNLQRNP